MRRADHYTSGGHGRCDGVGGSLQHYDGGHKDRYEERAIYDKRAGRSGEERIEGLIS